MTSERRRRERAREGAVLRFGWGSARRLRYDVPVAGTTTRPMTAEPRPFRAFGASVTSSDEATRPKVLIVVDHLEDAQSKCDAWRSDYNEQRPHSSIGQKTPVEFARASGQPWLP